MLHIIHGMFFSVAVQRRFCQTM